MIPGRAARKQGLRRRQGSAVLLLCVMAVPMILVLAALLQGARHQAELLDIERALTAQVQSRLAGFNKALYEEFGLMALDGGERSGTFERLLPKLEPDLALRQATTDPLSDPAILKASILSYMRLRLPASLIQTIMKQTGIRAKPDTALPEPGATVKAAARPAAQQALMVQVPDGLQAAAGFHSLAAGIARVEDPALPAAGSDAAVPPAGGDAAVLPAGGNESVPPSDSHASVPVVKSFIGQVGDALTKLLSEAIYKVLDQEIKDALDQYQAFAADCAINGESQQLVTFPNLFSPEQLGSFTSLLSAAMTVPSGSVYNYLALREYVLATFWPAGQPSQAVTAAGADIRLSGDHLEFRNLSGSPLKAYAGRQPGEIEQILTGARTPKAAISQVKAILITYRSALFIGRKLLSPSAMAGYEASAATLSGIVAGLTGGFLIPPKILTYVLLVCDGLREGFTDYARLMKGERLAFTAQPGSPALALDYAMHLRILLLLTPERKLLQRSGEIIARRYAGALPTRITASCVYVGQTRSRSGSLLTTEGAS